MSEEVPVRGQGVCVQCVQPRCCTAMHVTCAQYHGLPYETLQSGISGFCCPKHLVKLMNIALDSGDIHCVILFSAM